MQFSKVLTLPFVLSALFFLYKTWEDTPEYAVYIIPCVLMIAILTVFSPQIDWWWYERNPPQLHEKLLPLLENNCLYYQQLTTSDRTKFQQRVAMFMLGTEWMPKGWEKVPEDVKTAISAQAVALTFHKDKFLYGKYETAVVYPTAFPSPEYLYMHTSELYHEDNCFIFSGEQVMRSFMEPQVYYNVALHEYAKVYFHLYGRSTSIPINEQENLWARLSEVGPLDRLQIEGQIGIKNQDPMPVMVHHFFTYPNDFKAKMPEEFQLLQQIFIN